MLFVVYHRVWSYAQLPTKLNPIQVLLKRRVEVGEDVNHYLPTVLVESCLLDEISQLWLDNVFVLPPIESKVYALKSYLFKQFHVAVIHKTYIKPLIEVYFCFAINKLLKQIQVLWTRKDVRIT